MAGNPQPAIMRHLVGIILALLLAVGCFGLYRFVPGWVRGTPLQGLGVILTFVAVVVVLSIAEKLYRAVIDYLDRRR